MKTSPFRAKWAVTWAVMGALALLSLDSPSWAQQKAAPAPAPATAETTSPVATQKNDFAQHDFLLNS